MGEIRRFEEEHIPEVAALELKVFHRRRQPAGPLLCKYFAEVFLRSPWRDDDLPSLVYIDRGRVAGFIGVLPRRMLFHDRPVRVAVASQFMVDREYHKGLGGLELIGRFFAGPQDFSYTDGATEAAHAVWTAAGARAAQLYALQWTRVLRPFGHYRGMLERHPKMGRALRAAARASAPLCAVIDAGLGRLPFGAMALPQTQFQSEPADAGHILDCIREIGWRDALQPCYEPDSFRWLLEQAGTARRHGALRMSVVRDPAGARAGWHIYYAKRGGESIVLQFGGADRKLEHVIQALLRDAWAEGATALSGQAVPRALLALSNRGCGFRYIGNGALVHSRNPEILACILQGEAALSRLDGEWWMRFAVEDWD